MVNIGRFEARDMADYSDIHKERLIRNFKELVRIDSVSFKERKMANRIRRELQDLGISVLEDDSAQRTGSDSGNLFAVIPAEGVRPEKTQTLLFMAHMDTVEPGIGKEAVIHEDGKITSRGTTVLGADDLSAVACILEAVREIREESLPHGNIELLFCTAEEAYTTGSSAFDFSLSRADQAFALDCSDVIGSYSTQEPTLLSFTITVHGRAAHAGFEPEKGISAVLAASRAISSLPLGRADDHSTLNIGLIEGGTQTNIVPDKVIVRGEIRSSVHEDALSLYERTAAAFRQEAEALGADCDCAYTVHLTAYHVAEDDPALLHYQKTLDRLSIPRGSKKNFGGSDCNVVRRKGIDGICIANPMHDAHTTKEWTTVLEMVQCTAIVKALMTVDTD